MLTTLADVSAAASVMHQYVAPIMRTLCTVASLACVFFLVNGGIHYMTSSGKPENLDNAKRVIKNALIGLVIVLGAAVLTEILTHAYGAPHGALRTALPGLQAIPPEEVSNGLIGVLIKAITGLLNNIIQSVAQPFLVALAFFTKSTELMASNSAVFNLWLAMVGIADGLFVLVVALLGFHVMGAATFGFDEIEFKHLLPRFGLIFLAMNTSIFAIDGVIEISNAMIHAVNLAGGSSSVWDVLTNVVKQSGGQGVAALLLMVGFLIFAVILLVYYVGRLVTLYIGAVLSPAVLLAWLVPGFRDFSETAAKTYLTTVFVLFVHVVILQLAASLFIGMAAGSDTKSPDILMAMVTGLATVIALLKTQGVMMQFSYVSMGSRNMRKLGGQFMNGVSYVTGRGRTATSLVTRRHTSSNLSVTKGSGSSGTTVIRASSYKQPSSPSAVKASSRASGQASRSSLAAARAGAEAKSPKPVEKS
ncbi:MAG: hypothetical protein ABI220_00300 [Candidatus Saccharimonadales bacterium]